jgi:hypothetical protein
VFLPYLPSLVLISLPALSESAAGHDPAPSLNGWTLTLIAYQALFALVIYFWSQNPNLTLLYRAQNLGSETYEFSTFGAQSTGAFLQAVRASAKDIDAHWRTVPDAGQRAPRLLVMTGGTLPYLLPDAYVLELLVSYRHRCKPELYPLADYLQVVHKQNESVSLPNAGGEQWKRVSSHPFSARGLEANAIDGVVEIWFRRNHSPLTLPADINGACVHAATPPAA